MTLEVLAPKDGWHTVVARASNDEAHVDFKGFLNPEGKLCLYKVGSLSPCHIPGICQSVLLIRLWPYVPYYCTFHWGAVNIEMC